MLQIVVDKNIKDKYRDSFVRALKRECENQNCEYRIVESEKGFVVNKPYVVTEPHNFDLPGIKAKWDCDNFATARSIVDLLPEQPKDILIIGRGELIGRPVSELIRDTTNHTFTVVNSYTSDFKLAQKIANADIIINGSTTEIMYFADLMLKKILIDSNDNFKCSFSPFRKYNMSQVGKLTVEKIVADAKKKVFKDEH